jgi:hypothetical protein
MSLWILVAMVAVGITAIVAAVHLSGYTRLATLADERAAIARFSLDFPDERVLAAVIAASGHSGFLQLERGRVGVVQAIGNRFLTRLVNGSGVTIEHTAPERLRIRVADFTWPGGEFAFDSAAAAGSVLAMFRGQGRALESEAA